MAPNDAIPFAIVSEIADREDVDPAELEPPLGDVIDVDALGKLFASAERGGGSAPGHIDFSYRGYDVRVTGDGRVRVSELLEA